MTEPNAEAAENAEIRGESLGGFRGGAHRAANRRRLLVFKLVLLAVSLAAALVLAEIAVRIVRPQPLAGIMYSDSPEFGFWNRPNLRGKRFQSEAGCPPYAITTDSRGYRGARPVRVPKIAGTKRVVVLGDSFVFGVGVEDNETVPAQTERILNEATEAARGSAFEVVNAGCPGWGSENALAFWRARGKELAPDLLVVAFFRNDLGDNMRHLLFRERDGRLVFEPAKTMGRAKRVARLIPFYGFLSEHSHLVNLIRRAAARTFLSPPSANAERQQVQPGEAAPERGTREAKAAAGVGERQRPAEGDVLESQLRVFSLLMETLIADARAQGVPVVVVLLPSIYDCVPGAFPDYGRVQELAATWVESGKCEVVDLLPEIRAARDQGLAVFQPRDGHYTPLGNEIAARQLARQAREILERKESFNAGYAKNARKKGRGGLNRY